MTVGRYVIRRALLIVSHGGLLAALTAIGLVSATPSLAVWSAPRVIPGAVPSYVASNGSAVFATDARGDAALAWSSSRKAGRPPNWWYDSSVQVALAGRTGPIVTRTVWQRPHSLVAGVTVALDARGELTVAWIEAPSASRGPHSVRALRRSPSGRWSAAEVVGSSIAFFYAAPELAVAPDRDVLLTWNAGSAVGVDAAWRSPGHGFGSASVVSRSKGAAILDPTPLFDPGGAAHVYGTVDCDHHTSRGVMLSTAPHSHHFGAPVLVAPPPAQNLIVSFSAPGQALAAWQREECSTTERLPAAPYASVMRHGSFRAPVALAPHAQATAMTAVAANGGGGSVSWLNEIPGPQATSLTATADPAGHFSGASTPASGLVPVARDAAGDIVLQDTLLAYEASQGRTPPSGTTPVSPIAVQPAVGGSLEPSPLSSFAGTPLASLATAVPPAGRGAALVWQNSGKGRAFVTTWRP
jgi:hypothetical protein